MHDAAMLKELARQCRDRAGQATDALTLKLLTELADEYDSLAVKAAGLNQDPGRPSDRRRPGA